MVRLLIFFLLLGAVWYGWRVIKRQQARIVAAMRKAEATARTKASARTTVREQKAISLEKDPKTGVYRPTDRQD